MIQLTRKGPTGSTDLEPLRQDFDRAHTFRMRELLHPELMELLLLRLDRTGWSDRVHGEIGVEAVPDDPSIAAALNFVANTPAFLEIVRRATGLSRISSFAGRIYRLAGSRHYDSWHDDMCSEERLVGLSVNLGRIPYTGGVFRLREKSSAAVLSELPNTGAGDAIFFRISVELCHVVTPVEGDVPKTAFAGWFRPAASDYYTSLIGDYRRSAQAGTRVPVPDK